LRKKTVRGKKTGTGSVRLIRENREKGRLGNVSALPAARLSGDQNGLIKILNWDHNGYKGGPMHMTGHMRTLSAGARQSLGTKGIIRVADWAFCLCVSAFCSGCLALAVGAAGGAAGAVYVMGKLKDELNHPLPVVHEAAVAAMNDLELKLSEDRADRISGHMESEFSDGAHVWIDLESVSDSRCRVTIRVGLAGDEVRSRKIYDTIKQHLPRAPGGGVD
jgi:hypothetical protein